MCRCVRKADQGEAFVLKTPSVQAERQKTAPKWETLHTTDPPCTPEDKARQRFVVRRGRPFYLAFFFLFSGTTDEA
ncbi:hypothetical protein GLI01_00120 [Gluconacetobacter liquefaciens]|nr:hypothetical protein GLI01_00120 [Gluconacetobacter liquefaciens]